MRVTIKSAAAAVLGLALSFGSVAAGETVSYTGSGTYTAQKLTMTLGGGDIVFTGWNEGIATISTDPPTLLYGKCMALGIVSGDSDEGDFSNNVYCTFRANDEDSFDIKAQSDAKGGAGEVIGGGGRWAGATGTVRMTRTSQNENSGTYEFELEITTP